MKQILKIFAFLFIVVIAVACNDKNEDKVSELEKNYFTIENADYSKHDIPTATTTESLEGIDMSSKVMSGAMNYITLSTSQTIETFFIGVQDVKGHWEYTPQDLDASSNWHTYVIPVMISENFSTTSTLVLSGKLADGNVTKPYKGQIEYIATKSGAIEIKLAFSNNKDIDLHLYTPKGEHIYYGNRGGTFTNEQGESVSYGLDIDSNASCNIDGINKENIYIPEELVESGTYKVVVNLYENCNPSIATNWSVLCRYQGKLITPATGSNPAAGIYPINQRRGDETVAMTFTVYESSVSGRSKNYEILSDWQFKPIPLSDIDLDKLANDEED